MFFSTEVEKAQPAPALQSVVAEYVFRKIDIPDGQNLFKIMPMRLISSIDFFLGVTYTTIDYSTQQQLPFNRCAIRGPRTYAKNAICIGKGQFVSFSIRLKPMGLFSLLGIPACEFKDDSLDGSVIFKNFFTELTEKLIRCRDIRHCISIAEPYLLKLLKQASEKIHISIPVLEMVSLIKTNYASGSISHIQKNIGLSPRQLERNFVKEIGVNPKMYSRMTRFSDVLAYKKNHSHANWASVAYEFNYTDQNHLIKDFKQFLGVSPTEFSPSSFAF